MRTKVRAADLFCGAGGTSTGLGRACDRLGRKLDLLAVNHWPIAVDTHAVNHPGATHLCEDLNAVNPRKVVPSGHLDLLLASPECTHHSTARGGKPVNDQSRASAWCILRWATALTIDTILIENVREFLSWGPIGSNGRPLKSRKGETFRAFVTSLESLGYRVDWRVLNAADYGDPTTRERLFIQARRGRRRIVWPEPSHSTAGGKTLFGETAPWRPAREIIDWSIPGQSIFTRKKALSPNTLARIAAGLRKFGGSAAEPFLVLLRGTSADQVDASAKSIDGGSDRAYPLDRPMPTVTTVDAWAIVEPYLVKFNGTAKALPTSEPLDTVTTRDRFGLVSPENGAVLDILFRMLQPHELSRAMSFPDGYELKGNREQRVKQIGRGNKETVWVVS